jgi:CBS domain-containing protein
VAGPASSILLAAVLFGLQAGLKAGGVAETVTAVFLWGGIINAALAVFNLVPGFPLDGGRALRAAVWYWKGSLRYATRMAAEGGKAFGLVLIILGFLNLVTMNPVGGLWWILIGLFVRSAAQQSYQQMLVRQLLSGEPVARFMTENPVTVPPSASLQKVVEDYVYRYHHKLYPVAENGTIRGCLTLAQLKDVPREKWEQTTVGEIASPCGEANTIGSDADALDALSRMREQGSGRLLVERQGEVVGTLTLKDLLEFLSLKLELDPETPSDLQGLPAGTSEIEPEGTETQTQKEKSA